MDNISTYLLWVLAAGTLFQGSLAEHLLPDFVCLLDNQDTNQCDSFCLTELRPLINQGNSRVAGIQEKVHRLEGQLQGVEAKLEAALTQIENKLQAILNKMEAPQPAANREMKDLATWLRANRY